ncbi:hypothetical protein [Flavobacterium sp. NRK1]|uniref:hypothetical protein n=1 Tax=Flavobacterium sp. NRK1 TaxID=2954929 RepID=UPI0020922A96|nr:hypothetical protein [Flavobacterium sp. NRK1]MCO6148170.1 hypothetical protein [Flavobacterium sp. NRK1]
MKTDIDRLLIFKTDISEMCSNCEVYKALNKQEEIKHWSIDHDDSDFVLRIVSETLTAEAVIHIITSHGHQCEEL